MILSQNVVFPVRVQLDDTMGDKISISPRPTGSD